MVIMYPPLNDPDFEDPEVIEQDVPDQEAIVPEPIPGSPEQERVQCRFCGLENDAGLIFCVNRNCTKPLSMRTRSCACGHEPPYNANHCPRCGVELPPLRPRS